MARVPAQKLRLVTTDMIHRSVIAVRDGASHKFGGSREYDVLLASGQRLPPKAVFGVALSQVLKRPSEPDDFAGGEGQLSFEIIEKAGYLIVRKRDDEYSIPIVSDEERIWAERKPIFKTHLTRERARGLAPTKRRHFYAEHGRLFCERCGLVPSEQLGLHGDACIEVHHNFVAVAKMAADHETLLDHLQCLCANCHRIVHREEF